MKNIAKGSILVILASFVLICSGCVKKDSSKINSVTNTKAAYNKSMSKDAVDENGIVSDAVMLSVGDKEVTYSETLVYILMIRQEYGDLFGENIWSLGVSGEETFEDLAKEEIINQVTRLKVISYGAEQIGVTVEPDEEIEIENQALAYMNQITVEDQEKYGITLEVAKSVVYDNFLAQKVFDVVTMDVDTNVEEGTTDPESVIEARQDEIFAEKYSEWFEKHTIYIVSDLWNMINFNSI